jgi:hypothetical protein
MMAITTKITGGLGNQMFQYAAGRSLSYHLNVPLFLDISSFQDYQVRDFQLDKVFRIKSTELVSVRGRNIATSKKIAAHILHKFTSQPILPKIYYQPSFGFWQDFYSIPDGSKIVGTWQNEKYFLPIESILREEFFFPDFKEERNKVIGRKIKSEKSVAIHVRKGDYLSQKGMKTYSQISRDYYLKALQIIKNRHGDTQAFIFTDDVDWATTNLYGLENVTFVDWNHNEQAFCDMQLMALCDHFVTSNSTFSWWSAWLGSNDQSTVITPKEWFVRNDLKSKDIHPGFWIQI